MDASGGTSREPAARVPASGPSIGLALGGGGARGLAHVAVLQALDDLGLRPARIAGASSGAILGAVYAAGFSGDDLAALAVETFGQKWLVASRLWRTRPANVSQFLADGGLRIGQLNAERVVGAFLPPGMPATFEGLAIPLTVIATDFYAARECAIEDGALSSAVAASAALPAIFRPVLREGRILLDGGILNPLPFDRLTGTVDLVVAVDVTGGPQAGARPVPTPFEAAVGASQLMMQAIIAAKLLNRAPDLLLRPEVSRYGVLDFLRAPAILAETAALREDARRRIGDLVERTLRAPRPDAPLATPPPGR